MRLIIATFNQKNVPGCISESGSEGEPIRRMLIRDAQTIAAATRPKKHHIRITKHLPSEPRDGI